VILLVGATGELGSRIAERLHSRGERFRVLLRTQSDAARLEEMGVEVVRGDLRDPASLQRALEGIETVITTVTAISSALAGDSAATIRDVDARGNANLVEAASAAGVQRFVFVSFQITPELARSPLGAAKRATEKRLVDSSMREVVVKPEMFQEIWVSKAVGFDLASGKVQVFGAGETPNAYVALDDVAEATVRLALATDPPPAVEFGGPEAMTRKELVRRFEERTGRPIKTRHVPRLMLRAGSSALRRVKPVQASLMALALRADAAGQPLSAQPLRDLGIEPRPVGAYVDELSSRA
jgi:uncharacterized protein YbjT (DUF2867 family)